MSEWAGAHVQGPCAHDVVTTCGHGWWPGVLGPRSGLTSDWCPGPVTRPVRAVPPSPPLVPRSGLTPAVHGGRPGLYLGHPQVLSRGFGRAWEI